jgi:hypothetical protein
MAAFGGGSSGSSGSSNGNGVPLTARRASTLSLPENAAWPGSSLSSPVPSSPRAQLATVTDDLWYPTYLSYTCHTHHPLLHHHHHHHHHHHMYMYDN